MRSAVNERWAAGLEDSRCSVANLEWMRPLEMGPGLHVYFLPPVASLGPTETGPPAMKVADVSEGTGDKPPNNTRPRRSA